MNTVYARAPIEPIAVSVRRIAVPIAVLGILIIAWAALRPRVYYHIACASLGNQRLLALTEQAITAWHPELEIELPQGEQPGWFTPDYYNFGFGRCFTYATSRGSGALVQRPDPWSSPYSSKTFWFDERLRLKAIVRASLMRRPIHNRDASPGDEAVAFFWRPEIQGAMINIILAIGDGESTILAVVQSSTDSVNWDSPVWTNSDGDDRHDLEWLSYQSAPAGGGRVLSSVLRLYWTGPGTLAYHGEAPKGYKVWLAPPGGGVRVPADESVEDAALHLLYGWPTSPLPPE